MSRVKNKELTRAMTRSKASASTGKGPGKSRLESESPPPPKKVARKSTGASSASSSRAAHPLPQADPIPPPPPPSGTQSGIPVVDVSTLHPFLASIGDDPLHPHVQRRNRLCRLPLFRHVALTWDDLDRFHLGPPMRDYIQDPAWLTLLGLKDPADHELTVEFYSTLQWDPNAEFVAPRTVTFWHGGELRRMSINGFALDLGMYTADFVASPAYQSLQIETQTPSMGPTFANFWALTSNPAEDPGVDYTGTMLRPVWRILHFFLSNGLTAKNDGQNRLSIRDIKLLISIQGGQIRLHFGWMVLACFSKTDRPQIVNLHGGVYISRVARYLSIDPQAAHCSTPAPVIPFTESRLYKLNLMLHDGDQNPYVRGFDPPATAGAAPPVVVGPRLPTDEQAFLLTSVEWTLWCVARRSLSPTPKRVSWQLWIGLGVRLPNDPPLHPHHPNSSPPSIPPILFLLC